MSNSSFSRKRRTWPEKRRKAQAKNCRKVKPWKQATGPRTEDGKNASSHNALKHGQYSEENIALRKALFQQRMFLKLMLFVIPKL